MIRFTQHASRRAKDRLYRRLGRRFATACACLASLIAWSGHLVWSPGAAKNPSSLEAGQDSPAPKRSRKSGAVKSSPKTDEKPKSDEKPKDVPVEERTDLETADDKLPTLEEMEKDLPSTTSLLAGPGIDWIVLYNDRVLQVETVTLRPDPTDRSNTLDKMNAIIKENFKLLSPASKGEKTDEERVSMELAKAKQAALEFLPVRFAESDPADAGFRIHKKYIRQIIYYDDLILRRVDQELEQKHTVEAFELLALQRDRDSSWYEPGWRGADQRVNGVEQRQDRLLYVEASLKLSQKSPEEALALVEELHQRNPTYVGLTALASAAGVQLIVAAADEQDYRRARHFLSRLKKCAPELPEVADWTERLRAMADARLQGKRSRAEREGHPDEAVGNVEAAVRIWPQLADVSDHYQRLANRFQKLSVGVVQLPDQRKNQLVPSAANQRRDQLGPPPLFEPSRLDGSMVRYRSRVFEDWEPTDLERSILFRVKQRLPAWESRSPLTAGQIVAALAEKMNRQQPNYDERFASAVSSLKFLSPYEFRVDFARVPFRPESLFNFPVTVENPATEIASSAPQAAAEAVSSAPVGFVGASFFRQSEDAERVAYRRSIPEPKDQTVRHVSEIVERKFPSHNKAVQALLRGEILMLPHIPVWDAPKFRKLKTFFVNSYALPVTHVLQFHPRNTALANRTLRRAMVFSLDRQKMLEKIILRNEVAVTEAANDKKKQDKFPGRLVSAPIPTTLYGYDSLIPPQPHDLTLAMAMFLGAKKELKGEIPEFKMYCPDDPVITEAAQEIIRQWNQIGLKVSLAGSTDELNLDNPDAPPQWDIIYRTVSLTAPSAELAPFLTLDPGAKVESLSHFPSWLRQELVALEEADDWPETEAILRRLHRQLWSEVTLIPLWEVSDYLVVRNTVLTTSTRPIFTYQDAEQWRVLPWYPKEAP